MRNARDLMVKIGRIVNIILLCLGGLLLILGIVGFILAAADSNASLADSAGSTLGYGIWLIIANVVALIVIKVAEKIIFNGQDNVIKGGVIEIILGVLSNNPLYILAGIFSIILKDEINKEATEKPADAEEAKEEDAFAGEAEAEVEAEATVEEPAEAEVVEEEKKDEE